MLHGLQLVPGCGLEQKIEWPPAPGDFRVAVGRPTGGMRVELRDARGISVPAGAPGRIWLNGAATGWLGRFLPDGRVEEVGPAVTVDGWPFDTAEIESALRSSPPVEDATVTVVGEGAMEAVLVAFVVLRKQPMTSAGRLRALLRKSLPAAMVPSVVHFVEGLPRTAYGSVDWKALPAQPVETRLGSFKEPATTTEKRILGNLESRAGRAANRSGRRPVRVGRRLIDGGDHRCRDRVGVRDPHGPVGAVPYPDDPRSGSLFGPTNGSRFRSGGIRS